MALLVILLLAAASPAAQGALRIETQPGVEVLWDGMSIGRTNESGILEVETIPAGSFVVTLRKRGFVERQTTVEVAGNDARLALMLEPIPPPPQPPPIPAATAQAASREPLQSAPPIDMPRAAPAPQLAGRERENASPPSGGGWRLATTLFALTAAAIALVLRHRRRRTAAEPTADRPQSTPPQSTPPQSTPPQSTPPQSPPPQSPPPQSPPPLHAVPAAGPADVLAPAEKVIPGSTGFLDELRRRERELGPTRGRRARSEDAIDVEFESLAENPKEDLP